MVGAKYSGSQPILGIDVWEHGECTLGMTMQSRQCYECVLRVALGMHASLMSSSCIHMHP